MCRPPVLIACIPLKKCMFTVLPPSLTFKLPLQLLCTPVPQAHMFLEKACEAVTWVDMRATLKAIDIDFDKTMSLSEFFVFERKLDWKKLGEDQKIYI